MKRLFVYFYFLISLINGLKVFSLLMDTGRKLNVHKTFNLRSVSTGLRCAPKLIKDHDRSHACIAFKF